MKKLIAAASSLALAASFGFSVPAMADPGNGAIVIHDGICFMPIPVEGGGTSGIVNADISRVYSPSGTSSLVCRGEVTEAQTPTRAVSLRLPCNTGPGLGTGPDDEGKITVTPGGQITGICHDNPSN